LLSAKVVRQRYAWRIVSPCGTGFYYPPSFSRPSLARRLARQVPRPSIPCPAPLAHRPHARTTGFASFAGAAGARAAPPFRYSPPPGAADDRPAPLPKPPPPVRLQRRPPGMFKVLGRLAAAHPWRIVAAWLLFAAGAAALAPAWDSSAQDDDIR